MSIVHDIIDAFGGVSATAEKCGAPQQTVSEWRTRTPPEIPPWRRPALADAARREKIGLSSDALTYLASTERTRKSSPAEQAA